MDLGPLLSVERRRFTTFDLKNHFFPTTRILTEPKTMGSQYDLSHDQLNMLSWGQMGSRSNQLQPQTLYPQTRTSKAQMTPGFVSAPSTQLPALGVQQTPPLPALGSPGQVPNSNLRRRFRSAAPVRPSLAQVMQMVSQMQVAVVAFDERLTKLEHKYVHCSLISLKPKLTPCQCSEHQHLATRFEGATRRPG